MATLVETLPVRTSLHHRPAHKGLPRYTTRPPLREPDLGMMKPLAEVHEVVTAVEKDNTPISYPLAPPPKVYVATSRDPMAPSFRLQAPTPPLAESPPTPVSLPMSFPAPATSPPGRAASPTSVELTPRSHTTSPALVRNGRSASTGADSPVMRSMFPRLDPTLPLAQQQYYPPLDIAPAIAAASAAASSRADDNCSYTPTLDSQQEPFSRGVHAGFPKMDGLRLGSMMKPSEIYKNASDFSTPLELVDLWAIANGQDPPRAVQKYNLELSCEDLGAGGEIICFDSSTSESLYTLSASANELSVSRNHPVNDTTTIQISAPTLQMTNSSNHLIAAIFPKLAEVMAIDKSSTVAVEHRLDRQACAALQSEAVERAYTQEASSLLWDTDTQKYYLIHPTLLKDAPAAFPIEVTSTVGTPREIRILAPNSDILIIELSFETLCLGIDIDAIKSYSSLYLLDTLLSATLVLVLHLHRSRSFPSPSLRPTSPAPSGLPFFEPPPTVPSPLKAKVKKPRLLAAWSKSFFTRPTSPSTGKQKDDDMESATITVQDSPDPSLTAKLPHPLSHKFQFVDPADAELPRTTRALLKVLYWGFDCLIWGLGVLVNLLAMCVVGLGKLTKIL
ncbi:MAG: hypothetical protein L6R40_005284 [Gallowayella cf. fulva]|nr:MAG: hypothetical protein L6R40_005284 [Xanthomendoza cf. fulva]